MSKLLTIIFTLCLSLQAAATCTSPISRTNNGTNAVLTSTKYNTDLNTAYNKINALPGDCITDETISGAKLIDATVTGAKIASGSITTARLVDGSVTAAKLDPAIQNLILPGFIQIYGGTSAPTGYLLCTGASISRTTYAALFAVIGTAYGSIDGNSFNVPDFRGRFLRMIDGGTSRDPDKASRTAMNTGGATGDNIGSIQTSMFYAHKHIEGGYTSSSIFNLYGTVADSYAGARSNMITHTDSGSNAHHVYSETVGGNETRPINASVNYIIKY